MIAIEQQSVDIAQSVDKDKAADGSAVRKDDANTGAGDQGLMFGYATDETPELMPMTCILSHRLCSKMAELRRSGEMPYLRPDCKSQVTIEYDKINGAVIPKHIHTVVISTQHAEDVTNEVLRADLLEKVVKAVMPKHLFDDKTVLHLNPSGQSVGAVSNLYHLLRYIYYYLIISVRPN